MGHKRPLGYSSRPFYDLCTVNGEFVASSHTGDGKGDKLLLLLQLLHFSISFLITQRIILTMSKLQDEYLGKLQSLLHTVPTARTILKSLEEAKPLYLKHLKTSLDKDCITDSNTFLQPWELSRCADELKAIEYHSCSLSSVPTSGDLLKYDADAEGVGEGVGEDSNAPIPMQPRDSLRQEVIVSFSLYGKSHNSGGKMQRLQDIDILSGQTLRQLKDSFYCGGGGRGRGSTATIDPSDASTADEHSYFFIEGTFYATDSILPKDDGCDMSRESGICHIGAIKKWLQSDKHIIQSNSPSPELTTRKRAKPSSTRDVRVEVPENPMAVQNSGRDSEDTGVEDYAIMLTDLRMSTESIKQRGRQIVNTNPRNTTLDVILEENIPQSTTACDVIAAVVSVDDLNASSVPAVIAGVDRQCNGTTVTTVPNDNVNKRHVDGSRRSSRLKCTTTPVYDSWTSGMDDEDDDNDRPSSSEVASSSSSRTGTLNAPLASVPVPVSASSTSSTSSRGLEKAVKPRKVSKAYTPRRVVEKRADPGLLELHGLPLDCGLEALSLDIPISALTLRPGVRYLYRHGSSTTCDCEHFIYLIDMHLYCPTPNGRDTSHAIASHHMRDLPYRHLYPRQTFSAKAVAKKCAVCLLWGARYIVFGDRLADKSPILYCR